MTQSANEISDPVLDQENFEYTLIRARFSLQDVQGRLKEFGYAIVDDVVGADVIGELREFWLGRICQADKGVDVVWQPYLGEGNTVGFSDDDFQHMFRAIDLPWNPPLHPKTRMLCNDLNLLRNSICDLQRDYNLRYRSDRYGMYVSATYYPPGRGFLRQHSDDYEDESLIHFIVPLTFKGKDYRDGGLFLIDKQNNRVDVDANMKPGSVLFFSGQREHGVDVIQPEGKDVLGRLQVFGVPVHFMDPKGADRLIGTIPITKFAKVKLHRILNRFRRSPSDHPY